ncbi:hypothetical protein [Bradyrhizobium sacchari]|uniref:Uncharacterized protein n=1 Tax=Bradyrhizobium sacchari TaxID=1399419 RepID=A0A560K5I3_9BRAD|nr:hypothetical protein [Bradyrhizobium sacchari]TWB54029.1 hypothetical protein FBZ94_108316 [Bradyrhizobium sacchari]TWB78477.1 hypothetical protein FBZ95_103316 [Bradyrhizobium sacchari]
MLVADIPGSDRIVSSGSDHNLLTLTGPEDGDTAEFEGTALQVPGVAFRAALSWISD